MNLLRLLINTNIYISLAAALLTLESQVLLGMEPQLHPYVFIVFFATLLEYNLYRVMLFVTKQEALNHERHVWVKRHPVAFWCLTGLSVLGFLAAVFSAKKEVLLTLAPIALVTFLYSLPVSKDRRNIFKLREVPLLKIFLIAFAWSAATIFLPVIQSGNAYDSSHIGLMFLERCLFVFAITIPFDIRDMKADQLAGLTTLPVLLGEKQSLAWANVSLALFFILCVFHYQQRMAFVLSAFAVSALSTFVFLNHQKLKKLPLYHYGILDGTMLLQGLLVFWCYYFG